MWSYRVRIILLSVCAGNNSFDKQRMRLENWCAAKCNRISAICVNQDSFTKMITGNVFELRYIESVGQVKNKHCLWEWMAVTMNCELAADYLCSARDTEILVMSVKLMMIYSKVILSLDAARYVIWVDCCVRLTCNYG